MYSSNIEGIDIGLDQYLASTKLVVGGDGLPSHEVGRSNLGKENEIEEVSALRQAYDLARRTALTEEALLDAHDAIGAPSLIRSRRGQYRTERIGVGGPQGIIYMAVEPENVETEMATLFDGLDALMDRVLPPDEAFYHAALLHVVFAHIHPFADGNGRTARLLEKWFLAAHLGADAWQIPSEHHYWTHRAEYYQNLRLGVNFYFLDYHSGGHHGQGVVPFLAMLPEALATTEPPPFPTKELGEVGQIVTGGTPSTSEPAYWDGGIPWCTPTDITALEGAKYIEATERTITDEGLAASAATLLPPGSLVVCTRATVGELAVNAVPMATNQGFKSIVPAAEGDGEYLYYVLRFMRHELERLGQGGTFEEVSKKDFERMEVPFPPRAIRQRITKTLATWDRAIGRLDALVGALERRQRALMQRLLSGEERFQKFKGQKWPIKKLGTVGRCIRGVTYAKHDDLLSSYQPGAYILLRANNISDGLLNYDDLQVVVSEKVSQRQVLRKGDIVICMSSGSPALVGKAGQYLGERDEQITFGAFCSAFRVDSSLADPGYVHHLFQSEVYQRELSSVFTGTSINNLKGSDVERFKMPLPSLVEQRQIAAVLDAGDRAIAARRAERDALVRQQRGLMQRLLTGRVRLPALEGPSS